MLKPNSWRWVLIAIGVLAILAIALQLWNRRPETLVIATAQPGTHAHDLSLRLAEIVERESTSLRLEVLATAGATENVSMLQEGDVDLAIVQADADAGPDARLVVFLYPQLYHLIVRDAIPAAGFADLAGLRLGAPPEGSGGEQSLQGVLAHYGLREEDFAEFVHLSTTEMVEAFDSGAIDALFMVNLLGNSSAAQILQSGNARLLPFDQGAAMRLTQPYLESLVIPRGAYDAAPPQPAANLETVGVETLLLAHDTVDAALVKELTRILFDFRSELTTDTPALAGMLNPLQASSTTIALHEGAQHYYLRDEPSLLQRYSDSAGLLITLATLLVSGLLALRSWIRSAKAVSIDELNREMVAMIEQVPVTTEIAPLKLMEKRLVEMLKGVVDDLDHDRLEAAHAEAFMLTWNHTVETVRLQQAALADATA